MEAAAVNRLINSQKMANLLGQVVGLVHVALLKINTQEFTYARIALQTKELTEYFGELIIRR